jgi:integrase
VGEPENDIYKSQKKHKTEVASDALNALLTAAGFDASDLQIALEAIKAAKEHSKKEDEGEYKFYLEKTLIYEDRDAFIYQRATSKRKIWYLRMYDDKKSKPVVKSLKTADKIQALATARIMYIDIKGKINRGERLKSITIPELIEMWDKKLQDNISDIPKTGITPEHYRMKKYFLKNYLEFSTEMRLIKTPIDKIESYRTRDFGKWLFARPRRDRKDGRKSEELINNNISEITRMYHQMAIRDKWMNADNMPQFDKIKYQADEGYKRDIMDEEQYEKFWKYMEYKYCRDKAAKEIELELRKIFKEFILIMANCGNRPKELLGLKYKEITSNPSWDKETANTHIMMKIRKENSKTGRGRICVSPIKKRIDRIISSYKKIGITHGPDDYLFLNPKSKTRGMYCRQNMYQRLKRVLRDSGLQDEFDKVGYSISLYSFRHQYACWRLRYGDVPIYLLAKQMGTSIQKIETTYGHIEVEQQVEKITKAQGLIRNTGFILDTPEVYEENAEQG